LFDRIKLDCGTREDTAKLFVKQLLDGVRHCHEQGVCHRDLKPENLLLSDSADGTVLKIADFGFSARFAMASDVENVEDSQISPQKNEQPVNMWTPQSKNEPLRTLTSVVGSPFYVAPEILQAKGYSGPKADVWSIGVILYAILAGNLPFGQELVTCKRFKHFCKWITELQGTKNSCNYLQNNSWDDSFIDYPQWLFPAKFSSSAKGLIVAMLHPDPQVRIGVQEAQKHPFCLGTNEVDAVAEDLVGVSIGAQPLVPTPSVATPSDEPYKEGESVSSDELPPQPAALSSSSRSITRSRSESSAVPPIAPVDIVISHVDILEGPLLVDMLPEHIPVADSSSRGPSILIPTSTAAFTGPSSPSSSASSAVPPSFHDLVKRSTRFITSVPACDVLQKILTVIEGCRTNQHVTSIGLIGRVDMNWESYRIEVWGQECAGPAMMALQLYQMPDQRPGGGDGGTALTRRDSTAELFLVEFIRGQLEIFAFKRFYQWVRNEVQELVKKDYALEDIFQADSPVATSKFS
jgi:serine/threonine protein kinase